MGYIASVDSIYTLTRGRKKYEASNHLGNVMVVFTDKRINHCINDSVQYYRADLRSAYDYYPFGMLIPDRTFDSVAYVQLPDRVDTTINQRIKIQIPTLNPGQIISLSKDGETFVLAQYQSGYTGAQYSAIIAGSAIVNELSFEDSAGYLIIENTTLGGQSICSGIPSFSLNIIGSNYVVNCNQSIDTIRGGLLSEAGYLFGFNGMERNDEIINIGNSYSSEFRQIDPRSGRWWSLDPLTHERVEWSPYNAMRNNPIWNIDPKGALDTKYQDEEGNLLGETKDGNDATITIANEQLNKFKQEFANAKRAGVQDGLMHNESWTRRFGKELSFKPGANVQTWSAKAIAPNADLSGLKFATGGLLMAGAEKILEGSTVRFFRSSGRIFSPHLYTSGWTGGSRGNIKTYSTSNLSSVLKWTGRGLGVYFIGLNMDNYVKGKINVFEFLPELATGLYSTFGSINGAGWGLGWEGGRGIAQTKPYLDFKFWFQKDVLEWDVKRWHMCTACPR